jgi:hypothetical protein
MLGAYPSGAGIRTATSCGTAPRPGGAERVPAPAVPNSLAVARALLGDSAQRRSDGAFPLHAAAKPPEAQTLDWLPTVPGSGASLRLVRLEEMQDIPRVQDCLAGCRVVPCAKAAAGQHAGTAGATIGHACLLWTLSTAAG